MATIVFTSALTINNAGIYQNAAPTSKTQTVESTLTHAHHTTQSIGASYEEVSVGDVSQAKQYVVRLQNRDAAVDVLLQIQGTGPVSVPFGVMKPGEPFMCRMAAQSGGYPKLMMYAASTVNVEVVVGEAGDPTA